MITQEQIAEIVRNNDAVAEEHEDIPGFWAARGVDVHGLVHVAMQVALRVVMIRRGMNPNLTQPTAIPMAPENVVDQTQFASIFMDGFAAGLDAHKKYG